MIIKSFVESSFLHCGPQEWFGHPQHLYTSRRNPITAQTLEGMKKREVFDMQEEKSWLGEKDSNPPNQKQNLTSYP